MFANPPGFTAPHAPILLVPRATALVRSPSQGILALLCQLAWAASLSVGFVVSFQAVGGRGAGGGRGRLKQSEGAVPLGPFLPLPLALAKEPLILAAERRHEEANLLFASRHEAPRHAMFVFQKDKQKGVETCSRKWLAQAAERAFSVGGSRLLHRKPRFHHEHLKPSSSLPQTRKPTQYLIHLKGS